MKERKKENKEFYDEIINNTKNIGCECGNTAYFLWKNKDNTYSICTSCNKTIKIISNY